MDAEAVIEKNINLAVNFIDLSDVELNFKDATFNEKLINLFEAMKDEPDLDSRTETFDEVRSIIKSIPFGVLLDYCQNQTFSHTKKITKNEKALLMYTRARLNCF